MLLFSTRNIGSNHHLKFAVSCSNGMIVNTKFKSLYIAPLWSFRCVYVITCIASLAGLCIYLIYSYTHIPHILKPANTNYYIGNHPKVDNLLFSHTGKVRTIVDKNRIDSSLYSHKVFLLKDDSYLKLFCCTL